jgi:two-component system, chemotaxis family, response regulator Rcp1
MNRIREILWVEDNLADQRLIRALFTTGPEKFNLHMVGDGVEALRYLNKEGEFSTRITPDLLILDLNLPKVDGYEVLAKIKANKALRYIPVLVVSSSKSQTDIFRCYDLQAAGFLTKPAELGDLEKLLTTIKDFWIRTVALPASPAA